MGILIGWLIAGSVVALFLCGGIYVVREEGWGLDAGAALLASIGGSAFIIGFGLLAHADFILEEKAKQELEDTSDIIVSLAYASPWMMICGGGIVFLLFLAKIIYMLTE